MFISAERWPLIGSCTNTPYINTKCIIAFQYEAGDDWSMRRRQLKHSIIHMCKADHNCTSVRCSIFDTMLFTSIQLLSDVISEWMIYWTNAEYPFINICSANTAFHLYSGRFRWSKGGFVWLAATEYGRWLPGTVVPMTSADPMNLPFVICHELSLSPTPAIFLYSLVILSRDVGLVAIRQRLCIAI